MRHLRRLLRYLGGHRRALIGGLVCLLLTTALANAAPWILRCAIDDLTGQVTQQKLLLYSGILLGLVTLEGVGRYLMRMILIGVSRDVEYELRNAVFARLLRLAPTYYHDHRVGDLMSRATNDMSAVRMAAGPGIMYTANAVSSAALALLLMARISLALTALILLPLVLVALVVWRFGRRIHDRSEAVQASLADLSVLAQENLAGARVVRAYAQEGDQMRRFQVANLEHLRRNGRLVLLLGGLYPGVQLLMGLSAVLVLWLGGRLTIAGELTLGDFVAFSAYLAMLYWPTIAVGWVLNILERGEAAMGRIATILEAPVEIHDGLARPAIPTVCGALEFRDLTFTYPNTTRPVLRDVNLKVPAGSTVAVVGPTGCGKSTLMALIPRLYEAPPGTVLVDGQDVRSLPLAMLRAAIGFVPQDSLLFSDTISGNVGFGLGEEDPERIARATAVAQLAHDVRDFPGGMVTFVGERGLTLSGGQKQRTALARALAIEPKILVLDDALSAVDTYTEEQILRGLAEVRRGRTTLLVSHRISTVKDADQIVVLRQGRIVEQGHHDELVAAGGFYAELYRRQQLEEEIDGE